MGDLEVSDKILIDDEACTKVLLPTETGETGENSGLSGGLNISVNNDRMVCRNCGERYYKSYSRFCHRCGSRRN